MPAVAFRRSTAWIPVTFLLLLPALPLAAGAHTLRLTDRQKVSVAEHVVVATVERRTVSWNARRTLITTEYLLHIDDRLKGAPARELVVTLPGGTLDGVTHDTCLTVDLEPGARYLLFLDDLSVPTLSPVVGADQGAFREVRDPSSRKAWIANAGGRRVLALDGSPISFADYVEAVRELVAKAAEGEAPALTAGMPDFPLIAKEQAADGEAAAAPRAFLPLALEASWTAPPPPMGGPRAVVPSLRLESPAPSKYVLPNRAVLPIVVNTLPAGTPWERETQNLMSLWNRYSRNLFRVNANPSPTWAWGNGSFDITGFPSSAQLRVQYDFEWSSTILGVAFSGSAGGRLYEADIALNPAYAWTLSDAVGTDPRSPQPSFRQTMLHELGHAAGLKHPWETQNVRWDSVMNYAPKAYRMPFVWADDSQAVRNNYPGTSVRDGAVAFYTVRDNPASNHATYVPAQTAPVAVRPGTTLNVTGAVRIENPGTVKLVNPKVEVYLTPRSHSFTGAILLKTLTVGTTVQPYAVHTFNLGPLAIPSTVRPGNYHLALLLRDAADKNQANNAAWAPRR